MNSRKVLLKKCNHCGKVVEEIVNSFNDTICCGEAMEKITCNETDTSNANHIPTYEILEGKIRVILNHEIDEEHYIMWIKMVYKNEEKTFFFKPGEEIDAYGHYEPGMKIYVYCNLHGLWIRDVV